MAKNPSESFAIDIGIDPTQRKAIADGLGGVCLFAGNIASQVALSELTAELPLPAHFEQACQLVTEEMIADSVAWCERLFARGSKLQCPECDLPAALTRGDEIVLAQIEVEIEEGKEGTDWDIETLLAG